MGRYFYLSATVIVLITSLGCKKETAEIPFEDVFSKPYINGEIKLLYQVPVTINGTYTAKDTTVVFNSTGDNPSEQDLYGYSDPSVPWVLLHRLNSNDFQNRAIIFFSGTDLNSLTLPYTFIDGDHNDAQINYIIGLRPFYDSTGTLVHGTNTYAATTYTEDFELTILSRINNRLQGRFSGTIENQDGLLIHVKKGLFDIQIVEK